MSRFGLAAALAAVAAPDGSSAAAFLADDTRLPSSPVFWFAWVDFFPIAPLYAPKGRLRSASR